MSNLVNMIKVIHLQNWKFVLEVQYHQSLSKALLRVTFVKTINAYLYKFFIA